ncbi:hypothetical protein OQA88_9748 [Cercophora sp. LCS_1]
MFSPALQEGGPAKGTRSSRRRQRPLSSDASVQQPKAKRQRVPLSETTFVNPEAPPEMFEVKSDKIDLLGIKRDGIETTVSAPRKELSVRSKKPKPGERASKGDGSVILTQNNAYTVSKLPGLPDRLRAEPQNRQHGAVFASTGYALSLTHTHAFVWPYTSTTSSPETFTFTLPYPSKHASDPLPLGSLVSPTSASEEPGLVVVMPVSGKIAYWESISNAATLDFIRQQRSGVEDSISGMFSGEQVVQIVNAESAGFVLAFSSGRLAYMSVRDTHGRPSISVQFLRNSLSVSSSGFFGSLRHALSSSTLRQDIAAARASQGSKIGERVVVAATTKGRLSCWKVHRGGRHDLLTDIDIRDELVREIQQTDLDTLEYPQESFEVLDFTFVPRGLEQRYVNMSRLSRALSHEQDDIQHLLLLVTFNGKRKSRFSLVEVVMSVEGAAVGTVRPLTSYTTPVRTPAATKPRVYLPRPALVAFVVFDRAVVIASMASPPDSPDSQLQEDSHIIPATFEDVVDLRESDTLEVTGCGIEEPTNAHEELRAHRHRTKNPAVILLLQGVGVIRVAVTEVDRFASERPPQVTAKSKLEQAVFFGTKSDNPLVFQGKRDLPFSAKEVGDAAIELSHEIVTSKTPYIVNLPASLEHNMKTRGAYLDRLIAYLNDSVQDLDDRTRWILLYNAEKMAVATWIWQKQEQFLSERTEPDKKTLISETAVYINEQQKTECNTAIGEVDPVRHWFLNDVWRLDIFIAWGYQIIKYNWTERQTDEEGLNRLVYEAVTINNGALGIAYDYRNENWPRYGVNPNKVAGGNAIPEPWTATHFVANNLKRLVEFCYQWLDLYYLSTPENSVVDAKLLEKIRDALPPLTNRYFKALNEFSSWAFQADDVKTQQLGNNYQQAYKKDSYDKILKLKDYGLWDEAIDLAKEHSAFEALAEVVVQQILALEQSALEAPTGSGQAEDEFARLDGRQRHMGRLFDEYGADFAFHAYEVLLENSGVRAVLEFPYDKNGYQTSYLRTKPELAKISWINDVEREKDIDHAAETLLDLGLSREQQVWNKKIELSLGKLALLAEEAAPSDKGSTSGYSESEVKHGANLEKIDCELALIKIQDSLYTFILPTIEEGVDVTAEAEIAVKEFGVLIPKKQKALFQIFEDAVTRLLKHEALQPLTLIDLLTLANLPRHHNDVIGDQFYLALEVAKLGLKGTDRIDAERLIWRRCLLRDDWKKVNETNNKNDLDQLSIIGHTAAYSTMFAISDDLQRDPKLKRPVVKPSEAMGVFTDRLDRRWDDMDDGYRSKLLEIMKADDTKLRTFIEKHQLEKWFRTTWDAAEQTVVKAYHRHTVEKKGASNIRDAIEVVTENGNGVALFGGLPADRKIDLFGV